MSPKIDRPKALRGFTVEKTCHCGELYVTVNNEPATGEILEILIRFGKSGTCGSAMANATQNLISFALRSGMSPADVVSAYCGQGCHLGQNTCLNAIADAISAVMTALSTGQDINDVLEDRINAELGRDEAYEAYLIDAVL